MSSKVILRPEALSDIESARDWYEKKQAMLGFAFVRRVSEALDRIAVRPELFPTASLGVRFHRVKRFPFVVYYRVRPGLVEVLAVLHGSRDPSVWQWRV